MNILVTGFAGYIGPVVVKHLRSAGHAVFGVDTGWFLQDYAEVPVWPDTTLWRDIREGRDWIKELDALDAVVHLAGLSNDPIGALDPRVTKRINTFGTLHLLAGMPEARHVIVSSCSVYGHTDEIATTDTPTNPLTAYARAKADVDLMAPALASNVVSLRLGTVWGYSPGHRLDLVVNRMMFDAIDRGQVTATGNAWRPLVHVEDVAATIAEYVRNGVRGIRNVVGENIRMHDLAGIVASYAGAELAFRDHSVDSRDYRAIGDATGVLRSVRNDDELRELWSATLLLPDGPDRYVRLQSLRRTRNLGLLDDHLRRAA